jgi:quercetin dioxygenase-like cupin family protein
MIKRAAFTIFAILICLIAKSQYQGDLIVEQLLKTDTTRAGQGFVYPDPINDEITISKITILPGQSTGWHKHEYPVFAYVLKGNLTVELEDGQSIHFPENSTFAEIINTFHNGFNRGDEPVILLAFYLGEKGKPLSIMK